MSRFALFSSVLLRHLCAVALMVPVATDAALAQESGPAALPRDLSPLSMFLSADIVVKLVMLGLAFASLVTWAVWLAKALEIGAAHRRLRAGLTVIAKQASLIDAATTQLPEKQGVVRRLIDAASFELRQSAGLGDKGGIKERVASRLDDIEGTEGRFIRRGVGVLATIGSTAPFVGLFGTVWGIMNSFIGISKAQTTNLAVVAPGIAEALLATAIGLVAAIPAVIIYNQLTRSVASYKLQLAQAASEVRRLVSRDLDRQTSAHRLPLAGE